MGFVGATFYAKRWPSTTLYRSGGADNTLPTRLLFGRQAELDRVLLEAHKNRDRPRIIEECRRLTPI